MPTIYDVAKRAEVSIATVSAVLNKTAYVSPALTKRVLKAVEELDYTINHLAHALQTRSTRTIGMLIPDVASPDPFYGQVVRGAEDVLRKKGYLLILGHTYNDVDEQSRYLEAFRGHMVDGVLLFQAPGEDKALNRLIRTKKPLVFVGRVPACAMADVVATDIELGTKMGVEHLYWKGHRRIGLITVAASLSVSSLRRAGWSAALERQGIKPDGSYVVEGELSSSAGRNAANQLIGLPNPPTAIFADNLVITTGILRAVQEHGMGCPRDIEIVSSDDAEWLDVFQPPITTVVQPSYELGVQAAEALLKRIRNPERARESILLRPELRIRS